MKMSSYCGCCGREVEGSADWCDDCFSHLVPYHPGLPPYERTWFAQHHAPCPYEDK